MLCALRLLQRWHGAGCSSCFHPPETFHAANTRPAEGAVLQSQNTTLLFRDLLGAYGSERDPGCPLAAAPRTPARSGSPHFPRVHQAHLHICSVLWVPAEAPSMQEFLGGFQERGKETKYNLYIFIQRQTGTELRKSRTFSFPDARFSFPRPPKSGQPLHQPMGTLPPGPTLPLAAGGAGRMLLAMEKLHKAPHHSTVSSYQGISGREIGERNVCTQH